MIRWTRRILGLLMTALALTGGAAQAHEMSMAEMQVRETARGEFIWQWTASEKRAADEVLAPAWPEGCTAEGLNLHCGQAGLTGTLTMEGVGRQYSAALVKVFWIDGQTSVYTLTAGQPSVQLFGSAQDRRGMGEIARAYTLLGVEHILAGIDHLMFVIGLLFLVGFRRQLLWTITAFTAAHSLTLGMSALGWLQLRPPPVEATIALSIVLVACEALRPSRRGQDGASSTSGTGGTSNGGDTLARRWPALVAFLFGLVHGLGFAGALREIGLPENHLLVALLTFNVGVEIGQLMTVGACWALWRVAGRWSWTARLRTALLYLIGSAAAYWSWLRIAAIVG
ncbi:HupE/UreJ family protein [Roseateles chitinivorans]|uniref:HupE/UreJ family protein n=1 Tax=Roseateles chitinivorans TaxID=2917965 RepID=UPI003D676071